MKSLNTFFFASIFLCLLSCTSNKKAVSSMPSFVPILPYASLENGLDSTFDYGELKTSMSEVFPDSIFGHKVKGGAEFFVIIDSSKRLADIKIIDCEFYNTKNQLLYKYKKNEQSNNDVKLKNYLLQFMRDKPFRQNSPTSLPLHPTYCYIGFYK